MKKLLTILYSIFLLSCLDPFVIKNGDNLKYTGSLTKFLFPDKAPYPFPPVVVEMASATNEKKDGIFLTDYIIVNWKQIPEISGVNHIRLFFYYDESSAKKELDFAKDSFYKVDNLDIEDETKKYYSSKLSYDVVSYEHPDLQAGKKVFYFVKCYDKYDKILGYSDRVISGSTAQVAYDVSATRNQKEGKIILSWKYDWGFSKAIITRKVVGIDADKREVLTNLQPTSEFFWEDNVKGAVDCSGKLVSYQITALKAGDSEGSVPTSKVVYGLSIKEGAPQKPANFKVSKGEYKNKLVFSWDAVADVTKFYIYKKNGATWEEFKKDISGSSTTFSYEFQENDIRKFNRNIYYVVGENENGFGDPSDSVEGYIIPKVLNFRASGLTNADAIDLMWKVENYPNYNYLIYRQDESSLIYTETNSSIGKYSDTSVAEGELNRYAIAIKNVANGEIGYKTDFVPGIRGYVPAPEWSVSQGTSSNIVLQFTNRPAYLKVLIVTSRLQSSYIFGQKPANKDLPIAKKQRPSNYDESLGFTCKINRSYSDYKELSLVNGSSYIDTEATVGYNRYKIAYVYGNREFISDWSEEKQGYRQITDYEYLVQTTDTIAHGQFHFSKMHKAGMDALGYDSYRIPNGGEATYDAKLMGLSSVNIALGYDNYKPYDVNLKGIDFQTKVENLSTREGRTFGNLETDSGSGGIYKGKLFVDVKVKPMPVYGSNKYEGTYTVTQEGKAAAVFSWDFNREEINNLLK